MRTVLCALVLLTSPLASASTFTVGSVAAEALDGIAQQEGIFRLLGEDGEIVLRRTRGFVVGFDQPTVLTGLRLALIDYTVNEGFTPVDWRDFPIWIDVWTEEGFFGRESEIYSARASFADFEWVETPNGSFVPEEQLAVAPQQVGPPLPVYLVEVDLTEIPPVELDGEMSYVLGFTLEELNGNDISIPRGTIIPGGSPEAFRHVTTTVASFAPPGPNSSTGAEYTFTVVPEPSALALMVLAVVPLTVIGRRRGGSRACQRHVKPLPGQKLLFPPRDAG